MCRNYPTSTGMSIVGRNCWSSDLPLPFEMGSDLRGDLRTDERAELFDRGLRDPLDGAEEFEKTHFTLIADARDLGDLGREIAFLAAFAVKLDRCAVRFLTDVEDQAKRQRVAVEWDGLVFPAVDEK